MRQRENRCGNIDRKYYGMEISVMEIGLVTKMANQVV